MELIQIIFLTFSMKIMRHFSLEILSSANCQTKIDHQDFYLDLQNIREKWQILGQEPLS